MVNLLPGVRYRPPTLRSSFLTSSLPVLCLNLYSHIANLKLKNSSADEDIALLQRQCRGNVAIIDIRAICSTCTR